MDPEIFIPITLFGGIAVVLYKWLETRHKERVMIIEKGLINEELKYFYKREGWKPNPYSSLKWGLLAVFIGIGFLVSAYITQFLIFNQDLATAGILFLFGGLGLTSFYVIANKKMQDEEQRIKLE